MRALISGTEIRFNIQRSNLFEVRTQMKRHQQNSYPEIKKTLDQF